MERGARRSSELDLSASGPCLCQPSLPLWPFRSPSTPPPLPPQAFDEQPHLQLLKELLIQIYATPKRHHKCKPFCDHVLSFSFADNRIWFRNYQVRLGLQQCSSTSQGWGSR